MSELKKLPSENNNPLNTVDEQKLRASIQLAVEIKSSFELYAYRIIGHEVFNDQIKELVKFYNNQIKK